LWRVLDGRTCTGIDRQTLNQYFAQRRATHASFLIPNAMEFRFIRLTQTGNNHEGDDQLALYALEFFGTLSE
jgi:hypothetical protein